MDESICLVVRLKDLSSKCVHGLVASFQQSKSGTLL